MTWLRSLPCCMCAAAMVLSGCNSPRTTERLKDDVIRHAEQARYRDAEHTLNHLYGSRLAGEPAKVGGQAQTDGALKAKHEIVWRLERGSLSLLGQDWDYADQHFDRAGAELKAARSQRVSDLVKEAVANETAGTYRGQRHEDVYAEYYRIMSRLSQATIGSGRWHLPAQPLVGVALASSEEQRALQAASAQLSAKDPLDAYEAAVNLARGLANSTMAWVEDQNDDTVRMTFRYTDDGFARTLASAVALAHPRPVESDRQFAVASAEAALKAYATQRQQLGGDDRFRLELGAAEELTTAILIRALQQYDPARANDLAEQHPGLVSSPQLGTVLVLHEVDYAARKHILDVRAGNAGIFSWAVSLTPEEEARGYQVRGIHIGRLIYWVRGPAVANRLFSGIEAPAGAIAMLATKPGTSFGFALPVHEPDTPVAPPALLMRPDGDPVSMVVVSDIDAATRATLHDEAPSRISHTLSRVVAKQVAAQATADAVEKDGGALLGFLTRALTTSTATATEVADTRCWTLLPNRIEACLVELPPGTNPMRLQLADGRVADLGEVLVEPGSFTIIRHRTLPAPAVAVATTQPGLGQVTSVSTATITTD